MSLLALLKNITLLAIILLIAPILVKGIQSQYARILEPHTPIGIIKIKENIKSPHSLITQLHSFFKNPSIKGIVLQINCSQVAPSVALNIYDDIQSLKKEYPKPIITFVENNCTAEGYLIACAADYIIAPYYAIIGNIGTLHFSIPIPDEFIPQLHNDITEHLTKTIAMARKISPSTVSAWGHGKIFTGHQALKIGLIDEVGSLTHVIKILKQKTLIDGEIDWIKKNKRYDLARFLDDWLALTNNYYQLFS